MKNSIILSAALCCSLFIANAGTPAFLKEPGSGTFSLGTRNTYSMFNDIPEETHGLGVGGQYRIQFSDHFNTEWYFDYITSSIFNRAIRNDYHIGWSVMYYPGKRVDFSGLLQPYFILGHCFDYTKVFYKNDRSYYSDRASLATQGGLGTHINITRSLDISTSVQYMMHFGKEIEVSEEEGVLHLERNKYSSPDGHLLATVSVNFKFGKLWNKS
ncbi:MAG TPA: hypothetical protein PKL85_02910 [Bacteroidia bacterium]|nr:hypothetical protein [Bacteroidia bacterium]